jgi:cytochrome c peroxidase
MFTRTYTFTARAIGCAAFLIVVSCQRDYGAVRIPDQPASGIRRAVADPEQELNPRLMRRFASIHAAAKTPDSDMVRLGRMLFFDPRLSSTGKISCNSCHPLDRYGSTNTSFSTGVDGHLGRRNAPTVYNAAGHFRQFWDGRSATLVEQASEPLKNRLEMGTTQDRLEQTLKVIPGYELLFSKAFPEDAQPITMYNVAFAIAEFEKGLITPSRWDRYLDGDAQALSASEKEGARLFSNLGCIVCHTGAAVGGTMFEKLGVHAPWPNQTDHGRREITHNPADDMVFKVPSLRNVARTAPYFHDGSVQSLDTAVRLMAHHQLGVDLTEQEARSIATWLGSLTGELPRDYIAPPILPTIARQ